MGGAAVLRGRRGRRHGARRLPGRALRRRGARRARARPLVGRRGRGRALRRRRSADAGGHHPIRMDGHGGGADDAAKASLHTARLGLIGSSSLFVVLSLVLWSVVSYVASRALDKLFYHPILFGTGYRSAEIFLEERVQTLGAFFTPLVFALLLGFAAALLVLLPSLLEEISPTANLDARGGVRQGAPEWARI